MSSLAGKYAVITGASQGIGHSITATLQHAGVRLALLGRNRQRLEAAARELPSTTAVTSPLLVEADLLDPDSLNAAADGILATLPIVDILVNCGGAYLRGQWDDTDLDISGNLLTTNVVGRACCCRS